LYTDDVTDTLLQTKLHIPLLRPSLVLRPRLTDKLNAGLDGRLILISAQAGSGKTTLVTEWLANLRVSISDIGLESGGQEIENQQSKIVNQVAWLSLDDSDNDPRRFLDYLLAALRQVQADVGRSVEAMLQSSQPPPPEVILTALVNDLAAISRPFILVLDDYHVIHTPPIHGQLNFLLEHQPQQMRLVIITREDPPLPLPRLRACGQLTEIRQAELRFTSDECADFLQRVMGLNLSSDDIAALERRTEGWVAGLQLAALSMRGHEDVSGFIQAFTGSSRFILDYLMEEVFERQTPDVKDFLLKTSILERLSTSLCNAVTGKTNSQHLLEVLERANLFILPLDQSRQWYRYHRLFAELLRQRLQVSEAISANELHRSASQWLANEGLFPEAIHHALAGLDWERAVELIGNLSTLMLRRGELVTLLGWFKSLPEDVIRARPHLCGNYGWALMLTGQLDGAAVYLDCAERALQNNTDELGQIMVAQAYLARVRGDYPHAIALSKQALEFVAKDDILHRGLVTFTLGFSLFSAGHVAEAEPVLLEACEAARASGNDFARQTALSLLAAIQKNQGRLRKAAEFCKQTLQEAHGSPTAAHAQVYLASVLYEWNDLSAALDQLTQAFKASQRIGNLAIQPEIHQIMTHIHLARGDTAAVLEQLSEFHQLAQNMDSPPARAMVAALHADVALTQGDIPSASHWTHQMTEGVDPSTLGILHGLTKARLSLAEGKRSEAAKILAGVCDSVASMGLTAVMINVRAWQALAAKTPAEAIRFLQDALKMGQPDGFIRAFVDKGEPMKFLLERMRAEGGELKEYVLTLLSAFGERKVGGSKNQPQVEAMSERELEILRLLAEGLSNRDIAERLVITVGTAKSHVHHILEKMGTESRLQAVAKARELGLV
jgi:LuxR family maltose regulon positive regulatory protein